MRKRVWNLVAACVMASMVVACSAPETEQELLARADEALDAGKINAAIVDIKTALQQNPESAAARIMLGDTYMVQRDAAAAAAEYLRAHESAADVESQARYAQALAASGDTATLLALHTGDGLVAQADPHYQAALARAYSLQGDFDAAQSWVDKALAAESNDPYVRVSEALVLLRQGDNVFDAAEILARVTADHPRNDEAWSLRADVARIEQDFASAAAWYAKAAEINPFRIAERLQLVGALIEIDDIEAANKTLSELEKLVPDHPGVNFARGRMLVDEGKYDEGLQELNSVLSVLPDHNATLYIAATANARQGNMATAQRQLEKFVRDQPKNVPARLQLSSLYLRDNDARSAERGAREVLQEDKMNIPAMRLLALALAAQGMYAESAQVYQEVAILEPDSMQDRAGLGAAQLLSGETDAGVQELEKALAMDPDNVGLRERLISIYLSLGDVDAARDAVADYQAASDDDTRPQVFAARVALQSGDQDKARELFQAALARDPGSINANGGLAVMALAQGDIDEARARFNDALTAHPDHVPTLMNIAVLEEQAGDTEAMVVALERAAAADEGALRPRLALARYRISQGEARDAVQLLDGIREQHPDEFDLHLVLATAYLASNETESAVSSGRQMLRLRPKDPTALAQVARIEQLGGRPGEARKLADRALESMPDNVELRKLLVEILLAENKLDRAVSELAKLPSAVREEPAVAVVEGRLAMVQNRPREAEALFQRVFDEYPSSRMLLMLTAAKWAQGKGDDTVAALSEWLDENPGDNVVLNELAGRELALGNDDSARERYEALLEAAPENPVVLNNLAWLSRESAPQTALAYVEKAHELAPDSMEILDTYAMVQRSLGNTEEALALSEQVMASARPVGPDVEFHRALILVDADRKADALDILEKLVSGPAFDQQAEARALLERVGGR